MSILTAFTTQVMNLATELTNMYPEDSFFKSSLTAISLMKKTNPRLLHNLMMENMTKYREQIFAEDDNFFAEQITKLEEEQNTDGSNDGSQEKEYDLIQTEEQFNFVLRVRTYWNEMSPNTKKQIWMYLKVLFKLSDRLNP
jgi:hypothetical protein